MEPRSSESNDSAEVMVTSISLRCARMSVAKSVITAGSSLRRPFSHSTAGGNERERGSGGGRGVSTAAVRRREHKSHERALQQVLQLYASNQR